MRPDPIRRNARLVSLTIGFALLAAAATVWAHGLSVFAWVEGETVLVESKFSGGKRPVGATVRVLGPDGQELLTGETDDQGRWAFDLPQRSALKIVLEAGMGHRAEWRIGADEVGATATVAAAPSPSQPPVSPAAPAPLPADLDARLQKIITKALQPVNTRLARLEEGQQGPTLQDILGGLGYILGLVGIGAYLQARRLRDRRTASGKPASGPAASRPAP